MSKRYAVARLRGRIKKLLARDYPMVQWLVDAEEHFDSEIVLDDIRKANPSSLTNCTNARCLKRKNPGCAAVVSNGVAFLIRGDTAVRYIVQPGTTARRVISDNDKKRGVKPGTKIRLYAPGPHNRLGAKRHRPDAPQQTYVKRNLIPTPLSATLSTSDDGRVAVTDQRIL